jgi:hypothetical protein
VPTPGSTPLCTSLMPGCSTVLPRSLPEPRVRVLPRGLAHAEPALPPRSHRHVCSQRRFANACSYPHSHSARASAARLLSASATLSPPPAALNPHCRRIHAACARSTLAGLPLARCSPPLPPPPRRLAAKPEVLAMAVFLSLCVQAMLCSLPWSVPWLCLRASRRLRRFRCRCGRQPDCCQVCYGRMRKAFLASPRQQSD